MSKKESAAKLFRTGNTHEEIYKPIQKPKNMNADSDAIPQFQMKAVEVMVPVPVCMQARRS